MPNPTTQDSHIDQGLTAIKINPFTDVERRAEKMVSEDKTHKLTKAQAIRQIYRDNPELYKQYEESKKGV